MSFTTGPYSTTVTKIEVIYLRFGKAISQTNIVMGIRGTHVWDFRIWQKMGNDNKRNIHLLVTREWLHQKEAKANYHITSSISMTIADRQEAEDHCHGYGHHSRGHSIKSVGPSAFLQCPQRFDEASNTVYQHC